MRPDFGNCRWCGKRFKKRSAGKEALHCCEDHRRKFDAALRAFSWLQLKAGYISVEDLKAAHKRLWSRRDELALTESVRSIWDIQKQHDLGKKCHAGDPIGHGGSLYMGAHDLPRAREARDDED